MKIFLGLSLLVWLPYGVFCFLNPGFLGEAAGVGYSSPTGATEIRAMYGGLQIAIGLLAGAALIRTELVRTAVTALLFLTAGLGTTRLLGVILDGGLSAYTGGALGFELVCATTAFFVLRDAA
ncbi:MAG: DUF4345 domain-containing protein [Myxococcales bacterium]|jgi:hypothetical protein|nr:MAG: DUF4345 domain-containing protein [Myxococcales bacterium]